MDSMGNGRIVGIHRWFVLAVVTVIFHPLVPVTGGTTNRESEPTIGGMDVQYTPEISRIVCIVADGSQLILDAAAGEYTLMHDSVHIRTQEFEPTQLAAAPEIAFAALARGEADFAVLPFTPTPAQAAANPDLMFLPFFASGFSPVYNLPEVGDLILSLLVLTRIYTGNITMWNDPTIVAENPLRHLPSQPIQLILQKEPRTVTRLFTRLAGQHDEYFAALIPESFEPVWPLSRYSSYHFESGLDGPASYVLNHPYSLSLSFLSIAEGLGVNIARMINPAGNAVEPSYSSLSATYNERVVSSTQDSSGTIHYTYDSDLDLATGPDSWPFVMANTLIIPKEYSVQSCVERAEVLKFLRWMHGADAIRYMLMQQSYSTMITHEVDLQLGWLDALLGMKCEHEDITGGSSESITLAGGKAATLHTELQDILLAEFTRQDGVATYEFHQRSEEAALVGLIDPVQTFPDLILLHPLIFELIYPEHYEQYIESGKLLTLHLGIHGIVPQFSFPSTVRAKLTTSTEQYLPIRLDMETLASIFLGDITSWTDTRIVARNPALTNAYTSEDPVITVVLCGTGVLADASDFEIGNHFLLALNSTQAFQQSGMKFSLPIDWSWVMSKLDSQGLRYILADSEIAMERLIERTPGAIGYILGFSNFTNVNTDIQIVKPVLLENGTMIEHTVAATPASYLALAATATPSEDVEFVLTNARSTDPSLQDAWPIPIVVSIGVNADTATSDHLTISVLSLCFRARRAVEFAAWMAGDDDVAQPSLRSGRASLSQIGAWKEHFAALLHTATCHGDPVLWIRPEVWSMPESIQIVGQAAGGLGLLMVLFSMVMLFIFRKRTILRTANLPLQMVSLSGIMMLFIGAIAYSSPPSQASCDALGWLLTIGAAATFSPMCAKIIRVYHIHGQRRTLKLKKISNRKIQIGCAIWIGLHLAILIVADGDTAADGVLNPETWILTDDDGRDHYHTQCSVSSGGAPFTSAIIGLQAALLLGTTLISFAVRHVSSAFNESRNIAWAIWNICVCALIIIPLMLMVTGREGDVPVFLLLFFVLDVAFVTLVLTFGWKWAAIIDEELSIRRANLSASSKGLSTALLNGEKGTTTSSTSYTSVFNLPSLESVSLSVLEKYLMALESHIRLAKEKRKQVFGSEFCPAKESDAQASRPDEISILDKNTVKESPEIPPAMSPDMKLDGKIDVEGESPIPHIPGIPIASPSPVWRAIHRSPPARQPTTTGKSIRIQARPLPQDPLIAGAARLAHRRPSPSPVTIDELTAS